MTNSIAVHLPAEEQAELHAFVRLGKANARTLTRAHILLKASEGWTEAALVGAFTVCRNTVKLERLYPHS